MGFGFQRDLPQNLISKRDTLTASLCNSNKLNVKDASAAALYRHPGLTAPLLQPMTLLLPLASSVEAKRLQNPCPDYRCGYPPQDPRIFKVMC